MKEYNEKLVAKEQPRHEQMMEKFAQELMELQPHQQNEIIMFLRKKSIDVRLMKADRLKEEAEFLIKSCDEIR